MKKKVGLYFGTYNPIHVGHLTIANHMAEFSDLDEVWFVITPHNPFKKKSSLLDNNHRYQMVYEAIKEYPKLKVSTIEFTLPQPNYTIDTLIYIGEKYTDLEFCLIMGEDNLKSFHKWKNYEVILKNYHIYIYPRIAEGTVNSEFKEHSNIHRVEAPIMQISSTFIRKSIAKNKNVRPLLSEAVWNYIDEMNFYKKKSLN